jgi:parallel beta-helix repeat protein
MQRRVPIRVVGVLVVMLASACGGGGGDAAPAPPPPNPLYVRTRGSDTNTGADPANALRTITKAAQIALDGYDIIVGAGTYREGVTTDRRGTPARALRFVADFDGSRTGDAGAVMLNAANTSENAGFSISRSPGTVIDGFTITGGGDAGIVIKSSSHNFTIQNCVLANNPGDGIRVQDSSNVVIFNNLIYGSGQDGIAIAGQSSGSPNAHLFNNTVVSNRNQGILIGNSNAASPNAALQNNIVQDNDLSDGINIKIFTPPPANVPRSDVGYDEDFDLIFPARFQPTSLPRGDHSLFVDARFTNQGLADFHLSAASPAIDAGSDAGLTSAQTATLRARTTTGATRDTGELDLGYHFEP